MVSRLLPFGFRLIRVSTLSQKCSISTSKALSYKSSISLDKLYPESNLKITTPDFVPEDPNAEFSGYIPMNKLKVTFSCSSGPGGQNVNKVHTKVDLRFKVSEADWLSQNIRDKIIKQYQNQLTNDGFLVFKSELTRSQQLNMADCLRKLRDLIRKVSTPEPVMSDETINKIKKRKEKANRERLMVKRFESVKRQQAQPPTVHDL